jgi:hypothetical protein
VCFLSPSLGELDKSRNTLQNVGDSFSISIKYFQVNETPRNDTEPIVGKRNTSPPRHPQKKVKKKRKEKRKQTNKKQKQK